MPSLTYDTNIVSCGILKKKKEIKFTEIRILEDHSTGEKFIKNDYTFTMPWNLLIFLIGDFMCALLQMRVVEMYYLVLREDVQRLSVESRALKWSGLEGL